MLGGIILDRVDYISDLGVKWTAECLLLDKSILRTVRLWQCWDFEENVK
jgi:hypothetical protein